jgi:hypothetical protein
MKRRWKIQHVVQGESKELWHTHNAVLFVVCWSDSILCPVHILLPKTNSRPFFIQGVPREPDIFKINSIQLFYK